MKKFISILIISLLITNPVFADCWVENHSPQILNTSTWDVQGQLVTVGNNIFLFYAAFTSKDGANSRIMRRTFNKLTRSWGDPIEVYAHPAGRTIGDAHGGIIGTKMYLFIRRGTPQNGPISVFEDVIVISSTDLTMTSWSAPTVVYTFNQTPGVNQRGNPSNGPMVSTGIAGEYIQPFYWHTGDSFEGDDWYAGYFKTTDSGATWTSHEDAIYSPAIGEEFALGEQSFAYIGNNTIVAIFRDSDGGPIRQSVSFDNGDTWTDPDDHLTNLTPNVFVNGGDKNAPVLYYDSASNLLFAMFHDRATEQTKFTYNTPQSILNNSMGWRPVDVLASNFKFWGYSLIEKLNTDLYLVMYSRTSTGATTSDNDFYWGIYKIGNPCEDPGVSVCGDCFITAGEQCEPYDATTCPEGSASCDAACILTTATCGNRDLESGEECDDGNTASGDGCSSICRNESSGIPTEFDGLVIE